MDDRTTEAIKKKGGKAVETARTTISPDGNTATLEFNDSSDTNAGAVSGKRTMTRVAKSKRPKAGSHAISGSWQISKVESLSDNALFFTLKVEGDSVTMTNPTGQSYTAKLDGTDAPYKGDIGIDTVSVLRMGPDAFLESSPWAFRRA